MSLAPYQLRVPIGSRFDESDRRNRSPYDKAGIVTDNSPLLRFNADSALNNRISMGSKFNKRVNISPFPWKNYTRASIDLSHCQTKTNWMIPVDSDESMAKALAQKIVP